MESKDLNNPSTEEIQAIQAKRRFAQKEDSLLKHIEKRDYDNIERIVKELGGEDKLSETVREAYENYVASSDEAEEYPNY